MREPWVDVALARLPETRSCPACAATLRSSRCDRCLLDLTGPLAFEVAAASSEAADALSRRQVALDALRAAQPEAAAWAARAAVAAPPGARAVPAGPPGAMRPLDPTGRGQAGPRPPAVAPVAGSVAGNVPALGPRRPVPVHPSAPGSPGLSGSPATTGAVRPAPAGSRAVVVPGAAPSRSVGLQPVLAGAGAGLLAVATVVFVFFTFADDLALRALVTGVVTVLTVGAAVLLRSRGLRSSAEAVAALAVVLAVVDVELALSAWGLDLVGTAAARASLLAAVVAGLGAVGDRARVRAWVTSAVVLGPLVPLVAAPAAQAPWGRAAALLATACLTALAAPVAARSGARVGSALRGERALLGVVRTVAVPLAVVVGLTVTAPPGLPTGAGAALVALGAALAAVLLRVATRERRWYAVGGASAVLAGALLGTGGDVAWLGLVPALAAGTWLLVLALTSSRVAAGVLGSPVPAVGRSDALLGGAVVALVGAGPALAVAGVRAAEVLVTGTAGTAATLDDEPLGVGVLSAGLWGEGVRGGTVGAALLDGTLLGLLSALVVLLVAARLPLRTPVPVPLPRLAGVRRLGAAPVVRTGRALGPWMLLALVVALVLDPRLAGVTSLVLLALLAALLVVVTARPVTTARPDGHRAGLTAGAGDPGVVAGGAAPGAIVRAVRRGFGRALRPVAGVIPAPRAVLRHGVVPVARAETRVWHAAAVAGAIAAVLLLVAGSWVARPTATAGAVVVGGLLLAARAAAPRGLHAPLVGTAYGYALLVLGVTLAWSGAGTVAVLCAVSGVASVAALAVTLVPRVDRESWWAVLGVTAVPFGLGVLTVVDERSWWSVAACVAMLALEVVLVGSRRPGSVTALRVLAAALVLPTAAVAVVSAGALLLPGSGSPVVLPVVALLVATALAAARPVTARIHLAAGRVAVEVSAALTGAIAVGLAFGRPAAGPTVAVAVLLLLAVGAGLAARDRDRRAEWWLAAALGTAALWTALAAAEVGLVEAYTAPPALAALVTGALLARRGRRWWELASAGLVLLVVPSVLALGAAPGAGDVRAPLLVVAGAGCVLAAVLLGRGTGAGEGGWRRAAALRLAGAGVLAATGGTVESLHVAHAPGGGAVFVLGFVWALAAGGVALGAGLVGARVVPRGRGRGAAVARRWAVAPAAALAVVGTVANVRPVWGVIATVWLVEVALLALLVVGVRRAVRGRLDLPPAWFTWSLALVAAIGAWSPRELRVEVFSLPLGAGLLVAGYLALAAGTTAVPGTSGGTAGDDPGAPGGPARQARARASATPSLGGWPVGFLGSWRTLAPGLLALLGPSVLATYTDARTWRAVLVVVLALAAVLVGTRTHLAAPFLLGVAMLPVEILVVFVSQLGTRISAGPWMLTLAAAGGLLLIIATYYERRIAAYDGAAAYVRDLR
ncbi:SCO7613 C-terminal domain-containing membrane protein [Cellulosimicrobium sp. NPDC055967]|uniref:SCO7613 C-terminal domain-containing membrane protein n=1 Tax=Cellulosimicrobium sp. NPDC055967 TaxID=3345670 RepID=UPI0035D82EF7